MNYHVYLLECADGSLYCGITNDLDRRVKRHNQGSGAKYTRSRRPVKLVWSEFVGPLGKALSRERSIKKLSRAKKLEMLHG